MEGERKRGLQSILDAGESSKVGKGTLIRRWKSILKRIPDEQIMEYIGMAELPLIVYLLYLKYKGRFQLINIGNDCMIRFGSTNVANMSYLAAYIHFIHIREDVLSIEGNVSIPAVFRKQCEFYAIVNGRKKECVFREAGLDKKIAGMVYESRTVFLLEYDLKGTSAVEVVFGIKTEDIECVCGKINAMRFSPVSDCVEGQYAVREGWILENRGNKLLCRRGEAQMQHEYEAAFVAQIKRSMPDSAENICRIREEYFRRKDQKKKPIWLFFDRIDKADDNGEAMFYYVCSLGRKDIDTYFVTGKDSPDFERLRYVGNVVEAMSFEHCVLLLLADYILTSQLNGYVENPFGEWEEYFRDLSHQPKVIFLQHGITKDDQTKWLNRYYQNLHALVVSAETEKEAFLHYPYFYREDQIWLTGMPRYDRLHSDRRKYILFMPTWRQRLMEQRYDEGRRTYRWCLKQNFTYSDYFRAYHSILNNEELEKYCEEFGYHLVFMPHPIMQPYIGEFRAGSSVKVFPYDTSWQDLFAWGSLLVTDYSSVAFDFAYLKKPVIYYQFDRESFFGSHTYKKGYFDYENMGFGEIAVNEKQLADLLIRYMKDGCRMSDLYQSRVDRFFAYADRQSCERIFRRLMEEGEKDGISNTTIPF